jgi:hypothetical protein
MSSNTIPLHHTMTIYLTKVNYLLWRAQLLPYLWSTDLMGYLDGTIPAPEQKILASTATGAEIVVNPTYTTWYNKDQ